MAPRPALPSDDLYRRLGVPTDASVEAIELAWRGLLRRHHPDVAGPDGLELAKRINVAHDWLSDPALRARYDRERGLRHAVGPRGDGHGGAWRARGTAPRDAPRTHRRRRRPARRRDGLTPRRPSPGSWPASPPSTPTELDRLALAEPPPIAFGATIRRFLPPEPVAALDAIEVAIAANLPPGADRPAIRDAIDGYATELVLGPFLDELLTEPFRGRTQERLTRGWEAAVGQPRYGPNSDAVEALIGRVRALDTAGVRALASSATGLAGSDAPWPSGLSAEDDEALRVSAVLAARDASHAVPGRPDATGTARARRGVARLAHLLVFQPRLRAAGLRRPDRGVAAMAPAAAAGPAGGPPAGLGVLERDPLDDVGDVRAAVGRRLKDVVDLAPLDDLDRVRALEERGDRRPADPIAVRPSRWTSRRYASRPLKPDSSVSAPWICSHWRTMIDASSTAAAVGASIR